MLQTCHFLVHKIKVLCCQLSRHLQILHRGIVISCIGNTLLKRTHLGTMDNNVCRRREGMRSFVVHPINDTIVRDFQLIVARSLYLINSNGKVVKLAHLIVHLGGQGMGIGDAIQGDTNQLLASGNLLGNHNCTVAVTTLRKHSDTLIHLTPRNRDTVRQVNGSGTHGILYLYHLVELLPFGGGDAITSL